ncbi:hypothetical protein [Povalibacter sp.]|uniref:hypothetical protein n=1 Tax=Povalibacter sp. TaxID=1962978 RepID=UPI002D1FBDE6|nr:hypothetical protein [Povalibacter sp.]
MALLLEQEKEKQQRVPKAAALPPNPAPSATPLQPGQSMSMGFPTPAPQPQQKPAFMDRLTTGLLGPAETYGGLLGPSDVEAARRRATMAMAASLLAGGGPSPTPRGTGELIGNAMLTGQSTQDQSLQNALQTMLFKQKLAQQPTPKAHVVNGALVDEAGRVIYSSPQTAKPQDPLSQLHADYNAGLITQDDFLARRRRIIEGNPPVSVTLDQRSETEAEKSYGRRVGEDFAQVLSDGRMAQDEKDILSTLRDNQARTGPTQDFRAAAGSLFADLGLPISESRLNQISDFGAYKAAANDLVLSKQMQQKGPQTDSDRVVIQATVANAKNLPEVNRMIVGYGLALADRKIERAEFAENYRQQTGKIEGWESAWRDYMRRTPLAGKNPKSGRLVFWNEYLDQMRAANPQASDEEIMDQWRRTYAAR